ncbi:ribonuclease R [Telmatospirillum sp. J64-1]|uniref:ribonuclease R n=1 Tax=Telmatospirillum sp. J64-1 TaxID=2502183 RepID=UPI00115E7972|nr:ribonuclease R [Telmatospirillum sp. J64-1]
MKKVGKGKTPLPSKQELLDFIRNSPGHVGKREIARAFHMTGDLRVELKRMLRELEAEGAVEKGGKRRFGRPGTLPEVAVVELFGTDTDGELLARPLVWREEGKPPTIYMAPERIAGVALGVGDRVLARLRRLRDDAYEGRTIRRISTGPAAVLGIFQIGPEGGFRIHPTDRREKADYIVPPDGSNGAENGELVLAELLPGRAWGLRQARVTERLGSMASPRAISLVAIHTHGIPTEFSPESIQQAEQAEAAPLGEREDLRDVPLVTIDGEDARDFDDAVFAEPDSSPDNPGGWHIIVAIADVAWYVRPNDALDRDAFERGNSVYFPDRVVPMLPEALSNGWCSLRPDEERPCLAVHMWLDADGNKLRHRFVRGLMRSKARLTYTQVQNARDGQPDEKTAPLVEPIIAPLYGAWEALFTARRRRGVLELNLPERKVVIDENGKVARVEPRPQWDSHRLIEDFMIQANVAAAEELERLRQPCMYRVHDQPTLEKMESLREFLGTLDINISKGQRPKAEQFNRILERVADTPHSEMVNQVILRSQAQAVYSPDNLGHFGLGLERYAHFTSPIRRYADLLVHRALIAGLKLGEGGLPADAAAKFGEIGEHISDTERRAALAERDSIDRYTASFLADRVGATFAGRVNGVTRFGLFVTLTETGADGLVPISTLPEDYYVHDERKHCLTGRRRGKVYRLGDMVEVMLSEADPITGSMVFTLLDEKGQPTSENRTRGKISLRPRRSKPFGKRRR